MSRRASKLRAPRSTAARRYPSSEAARDQDDRVLFTEAAANLFAAPDLGERPQSEVADAPNPRGQCLSWVEPSRQLLIPQWSAFGATWLFATDWRRSAIHT